MPALSTNPLRKEVVITWRKFQPGVKIPTLVSSNGAKNTHINAIKFKLGLKSELRHAKSI